MFPSSKWVKVRLKGSKFAGILGPFGDGVSIAGASWNLAQNPTLEHKIDFVVSWIGIIPIYGDAAALWYTGMKSLVKSEGFQNAARNGTIINSHAWRH